MTGWIGTIVIGFIVGLIARFLKPGNDSMGFIRTTLVGVAGAFLGSFIGQYFGVYQAGEPAGLLGAIGGAILILLMINGFGRR